jgi:hypothetical protein
MGDVGWDTSIDLDSSDRPHISYYDYGNYDLKYARWIGTYWSIETVDATGDVGSDTSLALDSNDQPHISYYDGTNKVLKYAWWTGTAWSIKTVDPDGWSASLALDSNDQPHISYNSFGSLKYARWTGSAWSIATVDAVGDVGLFSSIALDSYDRPHISYYDSGNGDLKYAWWTGNGWFKQTVDSAGNVGYYTSLALDSQDRPHISYYDLSNGDLKYAWWTGTAWSSKTVDTSGDVGWYSSLALDSNDQPHIGYYDYNIDGLKYAKWTSTYWSIETVDTGEDVGRWPSLALDSCDRPHISYWYWAGVYGELKYALKGNNPPYTPSDPFPSNGAIDVPITANLSWTGGDPNGDPVAYDVYFGTDYHELPLVSSYQTNTTYDPGTMNRSTTYYWKIVAWDTYVPTEGPTWMFTTEESQVDPDQSFVTLTAEEYSGLTTCPHGDGSAGTDVYEYVKVTVKNTSGIPVAGIPASDFLFTVTAPPETYYYGWLLYVFTEVDSETNANGEIRFTVKSDTSVVGNIIIKVIVRSVQLTDSDSLACNSYDINVDGAVDLVDFAMFTHDYVQDPTAQRSDFDWDGTVDMIDFAMFTTHYLHG